MQRELTSTADVCRDLATAGSTGVLRVSHARGVGSIAFERGRIVTATSPAPGPRLGDRLVSAGLLDEDDLAEALRRQQEREPGERSRVGRVLVDAALVPADAVRDVVREQVLDAVLEVTGWDVVAHEFVPGAPQDTPEVAMSLPVDEVLLEVSRRRDEWDALTRVIPDLGAVPTPRDGHGGSTARLEPEELAVLHGVDGTRSIRELASDLGYGEFEAARVVYGLVLLGAVRVDRPVDEVGAALDDAMAFDPGVPLAAPSEAEAPPVGAPPDEAPPGEAPADDVSGYVAGDAAPAGHAPADDPPAVEPGRWSVEHEGRIIPPDPEQAPPPAAAEPDDGPQDDVDGFAAFAELREFSREVEAEERGHAGSPTAPSSPAAREATPPDEATRDDDASGRASVDAASPADPTPTPRPAPSPAAGGDVSEFLRELSRLAEDDTDGPGGSAGDTPPRRRPETPPAPGGRAAPRDTGQGRDEPKRKRRLFGR